VILHKKYTCREIKYGGTSSIIFDG